MLVKDNNKYIRKIYKKSLELHRIKEDTLYGNNQGEDEEQDDQQNEDEQWERLDFKLGNEAKQYCHSVYADIKYQKANDVYLFEQNPNPQEVLLTHQEKYIPYPRKENLKQIIQKIMTFQDNANLVDFHPNANDLSGDLKQQVDKEMEKVTKYSYYQMKEEKPQNNVGIVKIRNIVHQSLQPYNKLYTKSTKQAEIDAYFKKQSSYSRLDQWGKDYKVSPSQFLWLPTEFVFSEEKQIYEVQGKFFNPLENCPDLPQLKEELGHLLNYFSGPLKETHEYFKSKHYKLMHDYKDFDHINEIIDVKNQVDFSERIHAIVKITEMEIQPNSTYSGQWHVEGFSSDNILYTCLYVIEQDENLIEGKLKFKRTPRADDVPGDPYEQEQCAHSYCPNYEFLCDPNKVIPLGSLDIKENLMIIFPNQNIHKVKGIKNVTDKPLKRKIIAFFVVNHVDQPFTINDVEFTQPIEFIKEKRLLDMYERSKNKQTDAQSFNYCEH